ncbi:MAG TPA: GHMP kinase [Candidatus Angelobacter sp.]|nr:GHMP kinase [Candidatus Angelobacter sp.]
MLIIRTPARISFGGGGTDLPAYYERHNGAVLNAAINKYFYTFLDTREDGRTQIISSNLGVCETWDDINQVNVTRGTALEIPLAVLREYGCADGLEVFLASELPAGSGLGCSASMCVSLLQALSTCQQMPLTKDELARKAFHITANVLGKPVGKQDEYAAAHGGLNFIIFDRDGSTCVNPLVLPPQTMAALQNKLMLFFTGNTRDSWSILKEQEALSRNGNGSTLESLHRARELAGRMRTALEKDDLAGFGRLLHEGWQWKKKVSSRISNAAIDRLYEVAIGSGAAGGKITGAGGGGFLLFYCEEENQSAVREAMTAEGIGEMRFAFDFEGSRVVVNEFVADREAGKCSLDLTGRQALAGD